MSEAKLEIYNHYFLYLLFQFSIANKFGNLIGIYCPGSQVRSPKSALMFQTQGISRFTLLPKALGKSIFLASSGSVDFSIPQLVATSCSLSLAT